MISALVLAAGQSTRMGQPKMVLPWGKTTVLGQVIQVLQTAGVPDVMVVSGGEREQVERIAEQYRAKHVFNPAFGTGEMLSSLQAGLGAMTDEVDAALIALGDQPQIQEPTVRSILEERTRTSSPLIVPSYQMRRGHPWLIARELWDSILRLRAPATPRDFLQIHSGGIRYVEVDTPTVLADLDTPEDYRRFTISD